MKLEDLNTANELSNQIDIKRDKIARIEKSEISFQCQILPGNTFVHYLSDATQKKIKTIALNELKAELKKLEKEFANL